MSGDGVSLPTTLAQLGNVAKAQVRASNQPQPTTPFAELQEQKGELQARRVQQPEQAQPDHRVDAEQRDLDKRQRRRQRRQERQETRAGDDDRDDADDDNASPLGHMIDLRA